MNDDFPGGGEAGELIRTLDWATTPLGPREQWPLALKTLVRTMLHARQPMIVWWGPALTQLYNDAMLDSMRDKHPSGMGQPARAAWKEAWKAVGHELQAVVDTGASIWQEDMFVPVDRNGRLEDAWWTYNYSPVFDDAGAPAGILITCTETTRGVVARNELTLARQTAERARAELYEAFMQAPIGIAILVGDSYRFTFANPTYLELVGRDVVGHALADAFRHEEVASFLPFLEGAYRGGESQVSRAAPLHLAGTPARFVDVAYQPYRVDAKIVGVIAQITDVTAAVREREAAARQDEYRRVALEREQELRVAAQAHAKSRDDFLAMLSHELRNPLASIAAAVELMDARGERHASREREVIGRQVHHLTHLVDDLLDTARITRGKLALRRTAVEVDTFVRNAIEQVSPLIATRRHQLRYLPPETPILVDGDVVRLAQVLANLLTNAARYTPPGGELEIVARREREDAILTVLDNGPGFAPALLPHAFDLFVQGERRVGREDGGLGLGLALVKQLVVMHGGTVSAANRDEGGGRVELRLPALDDAPLATTNAALEPVPGLARRILVVDDNVDAGAMLGEILQMKGHEVVTVVDAVEALAALTTFRAEVGIFDIGLPNMDGYELARRVRALPGGRDMKLAAVTGYGASTDRERASAAGFDMHLTKPVALSAILDFVGG